MKRGGGSEPRPARGVAAAPAPQVVWLREPSKDSLVRAGLCLLGKSDAEIERVMREQPVKEEAARRRRDAA
jgi:hypothetical protein